jgi:hypothetical protein
VREADQLYKEVYFGSWCWRCKVEGAHPVIAFLLTESGDVIGYHVGGGKRERETERERERGVCVSSLPL